MRKQVVFEGCSKQKSRSASCGPSIQHPKLYAVNLSNCSGFEIVKLAPLMMIH